MYLYRDNPTRFFQMFVWGVIDLILWGYLSEYLTEVGPATFSIGLALLSAVILWGFLNRVHQGVMMAFLEDSWSRNFLNMFATPLKLHEYVGGFVLSTVATSTIVLVVTVTIAYAIFGYPVFVLGVMLMPSLLVLFLFGVALGIFAAAVVLRLGPSAEWFIWPVAAVLGPVVGVFYPISILPQWLQAFAHILPPTYVFEGMRAVIAGGNISWVSMGIGFALSAISLLASYAFFVFVYRIVIRNGQIARYSAESL